MTNSHIHTENAAYIHETALMYGKVSIGEGSSVWPHVVMRSEVHHIEIGAYTNIQDQVMIHVGYDTPTRVGDYCSITHKVVLHGCTIGNNVLVGIGAVLMDGVVVGDNCIIAGGAFLKEGTKIPDNSIVMGMPGKVVKTVDNRIKNRINALAYHKNALAYASGDHRAWDSPTLQADLMKALQEHEQA